jgi:hypothetical protein
MSKLSPASAFLRASLLPCAAGLAALALATPAGAQALYGLAANGDVVMFNGPKSGACNYPPGPLLALFSSTSNFPCGKLSVPAALPDPRGDIAYDREGDMLWATDGAVVAEMQSFGTIVRSFSLVPGDILPGALTGLAYDGVGEILWITDGKFAAGVIPPPAPGCPFSPVVALVHGPFALPIGPTFQVTDLDWDPALQCLWVCDNAGLVQSLTTTGAPGPLPPFLPFASVPCPMSVPLHGLAVDSSAAPGTLIVTDGTTTYRVSAATQSPAPPSFAFPQPCNTSPFPIKGLAFAAVGTIYGSASGGIFPAIGASQQPLIPNPSFSVTVVGAKQGHFVGLLASGQSLCPAGNLLGAPDYIGFATAQVMGVKFVPSNLPIDFALPLPPGISAGIQVFFQGYELDIATLELDSTPGLCLRTARP